MESTRLRAIVASEHPEERHLLTEAIEREAGVVVVGQAANALKARALARSLRPEVAVIDFSLPYHVGLDAVRLSRISGLDTAMAISQELPKSLVVLLPNMNTITCNGKEADGNNREACLYMDTTATTIPVSLRQLYYETPPATSLIFANVRERARISLRSRVIEISEKATLYSGLAILAGLVLIITLFLSGAGAFLAVGGIAGLVFSLTGRAIATYWPKRQHMGDEARKV